MTVILILDKPEDVYTEVILSKVDGVPLLIIDEVEFNPTVLLSESSSHNITPLQYNKE